MKIRARHGERVLGEDHPKTAEFYDRIGLVYYEMKNYALSLEYFLKAYDIYMKAFGPDYGDTIEAEVIINYLKGLLGQ